MPLIALNLCKASTLLQEEEEYGLEHVTQRLHGVLRRILNVSLVPNRAALLNPKPAGPRVSLFSSTLGHPTSGSSTFCSVIGDHLPGRRRGGGKEEQAWGQQHRRRRSACRAACGAKQGVPLGQAPSLGSAEPCRIAFHGWPGLSKQGRHHIAKRRTV